MIVVHHLNDSRSQRILWLLEELGLPYEAQRYLRELGPLDEAGLAIGAALWMTAITITRPLDRLREVTEARGFALAPRLTIYPEFVQQPELWQHPALRFAVMDRSDAEGLPTLSLAVLRAGVDPEGTCDDESCPCGGDDASRVAACLRGEHQVEAGIAHDVGGFQRVHLDGDAKGHDSS